MGRAIAMLLEHYGGALPFWLALEQVAVAPVVRDLADYAGEVMDCLDAAGLRPVLYDDRETLARRIVAAYEAQVPVVAVLGRREAEARSVTLRERDGAQSSIPLNQVGEVLAAKVGLGYWCCLQSSTGPLEAGSPRNVFNQQPLLVKQWLKY